MPLLLPPAPWFSLCLLLSLCFISDAPCNKCGGHTCLSSSPRVILPNWKVLCTFALKGGSFVPSVDAYDLEALDFCNPGSCVTDNSFPNVLLLAVKELSFSCLHHQLPCHLLPKALCCRTISGQLLSVYNEGPVGRTKDQNTGLLLLNDGKEASDRFKGNRFRLLPLLNSIHLSKYFDGVDYENVIAQQRHMSVQNGHGSWMSTGGWPIFLPLPFAYCHAMWYLNSFNLKQPMRSHKEASWLDKMWRHVIVGLFLLKEKKSGISGDKHEKG